ncbi:MAG: DNA gyrase inhibitor YacG [Bacteriovorax sp.]|nr:DNA gyrase inhibitor YacG [Bacteriovorax sp.]
MNKLLKVKCPQCDKVFYYYESEYRPFCCERCKMIDLGHWFEESYRVPGKETIQTDHNNENKQNESQNEDHEQELYSDQDQFEDDENNY